MKRLFVLKRARGTDLGRALVEARLNAARRLGMTRIYVDTLKNSHEMHQLYESMGFEPCAPYPESGTAAGFPEIMPHFVYDTRAL